MGALHPAGSLYERPVNVRECTAQCVCPPPLLAHSGCISTFVPLTRVPNSKTRPPRHNAFRAALRAAGVRCLTVREILLHDTDTSVRARVELEDLAAGRLLYELDAQCDSKLVSPEDRFFVGDSYKRTVLEAMSAEQLIDVVLCGPTVHVMPSFR